MSKKLFEVAVIVRVSESSQTKAECEVRDLMNYAFEVSNDKGCFKDFDVKGQGGRGSRPFTVIGFDASSRQIRMIYVTASNVFQSFAAAAKMEKDAGREIEFVCTLPGHLEEGAPIGFPGEGLVDYQTVLEQPDVFGRPPRQKKQNA